jgi:dienelactone hydrolase
MIYFNHSKGLLIIILLFLSIFPLTSQIREGPVVASKVASIIKIPVVSGPLTIDGKMDDIAWKSALSLSLDKSDDNFAGPGGETWLVVNGNYLCLGARIPEPGMLIARSTGINPKWWREDMIIWMLRYQPPSSQGKIAALFVVNPLGAYTLGSIKDIYNISRNDIFTSASIEWSDEILVASGIDHNEWRIEAALPLERLGKVGFFSVERIRVPRVNTPENIWHWPAPNEQVPYKLEAGKPELSPLFKPSALPCNDLTSASLIPINKLAAEVKALPRQVWSPEQQDSLGVKKMLENSIKKRMAMYADLEKNSWKQINSVEDWEKFRNKSLLALFNSLGPLPERTPLNPIVTRRIDKGDGFVIENIVFESRPNLIVTANLYLPDKFSGRIPAIIVVHSQHAPKTQSELQDMGMTWARSGTAVFIMDQLCAGERTQTQPWSRESYYGRYSLGNQLYLAGESLIKWMAWDIIRGIDLLVERNYIDPKRIVLLGAVAGGGDPAALTANLDPRIAAVIPFNFGEAGPEEHYTEGPRWYDSETADPGWAFWETTRNLPKSVSGQFFPWFICAAGAPRYFIYSFELGWPRTVEEEPAWSRYKKVYNLYGSRDHLASVDGFGPFPGPGECTNVGSYLRKRIYPILGSWLDIPVPETEYHNVIPEYELMCLNNSSLVSRKLQPASLISLEIVRKRSYESKTKRSELNAKDRTIILRNKLEEKLGDIVPEDSPGVSKLWQKISSTFSIEAFSIDTEKGISIPFFLLTPNNSSNNHPAVIAVAEGGKELFLASRSDEIAVLLSKGISVCLTDVRGCGEIAGYNSRGPGAMSLAANELMLGRTLTGSRLKDVRTVFRWLSVHSGIDPNLIGLWGDSFSEPNAPDFRFYQSPGQQQGPVQQRQAEPLGPFLVLLTALYEENVKAIATRGGLISFASALENSFCQIPQDVIVPGFLEVTDIGEMVNTIAPRPILLAGLVNGLNKKVNLSIMKKEYGSNLPGIKLSIDSENQLLANWIAEHFLKK